MPIQELTLILGFSLIIIFAMLAGFIIGAWIMFKGKSSSQPGEQFIGTPKGDVFRIETEEEQLFPPVEESEAEKHVAERGMKFIKRMAQ